MNTCRTIRAAPALLLAACSVGGQTITGSIVGTVLDPSTLPIAKADVF